MNANEPSSDGRALVLYDGNCRLCQRSVAILNRLDWLGRLNCQDARDLDHLPVREPPLDPARLLEEMHLVTPDGKRVYHGFAVFRWMAWRLPALWFIAPFLYIPGVPTIGQRIYLWVARNRFQLVPCKDGVCEVPSSKFRVPSSELNQEPKS